MRKVLFAAGAALLATQSAAQPPHAPKLLVVIAVDQFSANLWDEYRPHWTGGFAKLAKGPCSTTAIRATRIRRPRGV